jgi:hypothetical protein
VSDLLAVAVVAVAGAALVVAAAAVVVAVVAAVAAAAAVVVEGSVGRPSVKPFNKSAAEKRKKEISRQQWQKEKAERLLQRQQEREKRGALDPGEDPDIAGIVPGPQPTAEPPAPLDTPALPAPPDEKA